jgi:tRNA(Ser,Leu) C12 N-acetylase TAN1
LESDQARRVGKLVVTSRAPFTARKTRSAIRRAVSPARFIPSGFRSVFVVEAEGEPLELAQQVYRDCGKLIGRGTAVLSEVESKLDAIKQAAVKIGTERIGSNESFAFRLFKRGLHNLEEDTPKIEQEIGSAINAALEQQHGIKPSVDLSDPDVEVNAEVLGPITLVGVFKKSWQTIAQPQNLKQHCWSGDSVSLPLSPLISAISCARQMPGFPKEPPQEAESNGRSSTRSCIKPR